MADAGAVVVRPGRRAARGCPCRGSGFRPFSVVLPVHAACVGAPGRLALQGRVPHLRDGPVLLRRFGRQAVGARSLCAAESPRFARPRIQLGAADARGGPTGVPGAIRSALRRAHHLYRRHLHRRARHAAGAAAGIHCARDGRGGRVCRRVRGARDPVVVCRVVACCAVVRGDFHRGRVRRRLHRQTQRAGSRAALYLAQHRVHAAGVRADAVHTARVSGRDDRAGRRRGGQPADAAEHPPVGLAGAAGHAETAAGDSHVPTTFRTSTSIGTSWTDRSGR